MAEPLISLAPSSGLGGLRAVQPARLQALRSLSDNAEQIERAWCVRETARRFRVEGGGLSQKMLTGFNTNIRHRSVLFHVQSEDSGRAHPHIITHLYHGGTIIHSEKSSYAARVNEVNLEDVVRGLMEGQHKAVLKRLRAGEFDAAIRERLGDVLAASDGDSKAKTKPTETSPLAAAASAPEPEAERELPTAAQLVATTPASGAKGASGERPLDDAILGYLIENARKRRAK